MTRFSVPTINDFLDQLRMQADREVAAFQKRKNEIDSLCSKAGMTQSSRRIILLLDAIDEHVESGVALSLGELRRALEYPELDPLELRNLVGPRLDELATRIIQSANLEQAARSLQSVQNEIKKRSDRVRANIRFWIRQFDIGWDAPVEPESLKLPPKNS